MCNKFMLRVVVVTYCVFAFTMASIYPDDPKYFNGLNFLLGILLPSPLVTREQKHD